MNVIYNYLRMGTTRVRSFLIQELFAFDTGDSGKISLKKLIVTILD